MKVILMLVLLPITLPLSVVSLLGIFCLKMVTVKTSRSRL